MFDRGSVADLPLKANQVDVAVTPQVLNRRGVAGRALEQPQQIDIGTAVDRLAPLRTPRPSAAPRTLDP